MFSTLSDKITSSIKTLAGKGIVKEKDINEAMKAVRMALLEADVNYQVAKDFCAKVSEKALGADVLKSLRPDQQVIKIVHDELVEMLGSSAAELNLKVAPPAVIMLVGLQGSGKTTSCGKLALHLKKQLKRNPILVPADVYRPAAIDQLKTLGTQLNIPVFDSNVSQKPQDIARQAHEQAQLQGYDTLILDTAGRLQIDTTMMEELKELTEIVDPHETLLVCDAMTGQEAVNVASGFSDYLDISGLILTKLDGDARGGAALSMQAVTGKAIKFVGLGEKLSALEVFHPSRMADRILGMGDVMTLIEKASNEISVEESSKLQKKMQKNDLDLNDFLGQLRMMKRMGSIGSLMGMIPGMDKLSKQIDPDQAENELKKVEAIILSMTIKERLKPSILNGSRRKRIAKGSGTKVQDVNQLLKQFMDMKKMMKQMNKMGMGKMMKMLGGGAGGNPLKNLKF